MAINGTSGLDVVRSVKLTGTLLPAAGGYPILGEDVVVVRHDK
ncbi:MAG TPA: hypothetical protein VKK06_22950 [Terriglobia bacterium]|nr:hypothetical protein [Terriglobia bacterium]